MLLLMDVAEQLNLRWAWEKVRSQAVSGDAWVDEIELAEFELELKKNLSNISKEIRNGRYKLS